MQSDTYLSDKQVAERYKVGRSTIWRWIQEQKFPKPIKFSQGCSRFKLSLIEKWEAEKEAV
jgi:prophage regulatory protein